MPPAALTYLRARRFGALDGLRAISVIAVIWQHTSGRPGPYFSQRGYLGVEFFFAVSGFLITTLLIREFGRTGGISLRKFYVRRALRIFPLYYAVLLVYIVLTVATRADTPQGKSFLAHLPAFATYTSNWFVDLTHGTSVTFYFAWSLATEEQFYLLWPPLLVLLVIVGRRYGIRLACGALLVLVALDQTATLVGDPDQLWVRIVSSLSTPILLGALLALLLNSPVAFPAIAWSLGRRWSAPVVFALLVAAIALPTPIQVPQVLMVLAVGTVVISERTLLHPVLEWRPLAFVGVISYGIYLMHMLVANVVRIVVHQQSSPLVFVLTLAVVIGVAFLSFRFFETPLLRLKQRFEVQPHADELSRLDDAEGRGANV